jgi:hypothetical protein
MRGSSVNQSINHPTEGNSRVTPEISNHHIAGYLVLSIPIVLLMSIIGYKKYRIITLRRRIEKLERLWHMDVDEKKH